MRHSLHTMAETSAADDAGAPSFDPVEASRRECEYGNFAKGLEVLRGDIRASGRATARMVSEIVRVYFISGDRRSGVAELDDWKAGLAADYEPGPYDDVLALQGAILGVSSLGRLDEAVRVADLLWPTRYGLDCLSPSDLEGAANDTRTRVGYYAVEIYDLYRRYGQGLRAPSFTPSGHEFRLITTGLIKAHLAFEALEVAEYLVTGEPALLPSVAAMLLSQGSPAGEDAILRHAKAQLEEGKLGDAKETLESLDETEVRGLRVMDKRAALVLRYLDSGPDKTRCVRGLLQLAGSFEKADEWDAAMETLESAAEVHCTLGVTDETIQLGFEIHERLQHVTERSGDLLSGIQFSLRLCDMISSTTENLAAARARRDELLSWPICSRLPFFGKFHRRQCLEYLMVNQRGPALDHAEKYVRYCETLQDEEQLSLANNLRLTALVHGDRMSEEAREVLLEGAREELEQGISQDRGAGRCLAHVEKALLLVEVTEELGRLQGEEREDVWTSIAEILGDAETICSRIRPASDGVLLSLQVSYLKTLFTKASGDSYVTIVGSDSEQAAAGSLDTALAAAGRPGHRTRLSFSETKFVAGLYRAVQSLSAPILVAVVQDMTNEEARLSSEGHPLEKLRFFVCQGILYYILVKCVVSGHVRTEDLPFATQVAGLSMSLQFFEKALALEAELSRKTGAVPDNLAALTALQAFRSSPFKSLLSETAVSICWELEDNSLLWKWVQMNKAQAYSTWLRQNSSDSPTWTPPTRQCEPSFEDMLWVSSATGRRLVFVDWVVVRRDPDPPVLLLLALRFLRGEHGPLRRLTVAEVDMSVGELEDRARNLTPARLESNDWRRVMTRLAALVEPLSEVCSEEDMLVLSPTAPLHNLPLHALPLFGKPLLKRNPCLYTPSMSVLVSCLRRLEAPAPGAERPGGWSAAVLGAYDDDSASEVAATERREIYHSLATIAAQLGTTPVLGSSLSVGTFAKVTRPSNLVHFHGHASLSPHNPLDQSVLLGAPHQHLTLRLAASLAFDATPHVNLIACSSGVQDFSGGGDEPLGLMSAILASGAASAIGALWPIQSATGRAFTKTFFEVFLEADHDGELGPVVNLAEAVRRASIRLMENEETGAPYHWAAFVLYGAWFCSRKP